MPNSADSPHFFRQLGLALIGTSCLSAGLENVRLHDAVATPSSMTASGFTIAPDSATVAIRANFDRPAVHEYWLVPITGGTPVPANLDAPGASVGGLLSADAGGAFTGDSSIFVSRAMLDQAGSPKDGVQAAGLQSSPYNLTLQTDGTVGKIVSVPNRDFILFESTNWSWKTLLLQTPGGTPLLTTPFGHDVTDYAVDPSGAYLVTSATGGSVAREAVYSTKLAVDGTTTTIPLTGAPVIGGGITDFKISGDAASVVIRGPISAISAEELVSCPIDGSGPLVSLVATPASVTDYAISPDGTRVVYLRKVGIAKPELYVKPINGGTAVKLSGTLPTGANGIADFAITADSQRVVYRADQTTAGINELFSTKMDGTGNLKLNTAVVGSVSAFKLSPEGGFVIYRADAAVALRHELFHVAVDGGAVTRQHPALGVGRSVRSDFAIPSEHHIAFRADISGVSGQVQLYTARAANPAITRMDTIAIPGGDVDSFEAAEDGQSLVYLADVEHDGTLEVHAAWGLPEITPLANRWGPLGMPVPSQTFSVSDVETPGDALILTTASSNPAVVAPSGITVVGIGSSRTISITPVAGATGSTVITVQVSDGKHVATREFTVIRYSTEYWGWLSSNFGLPTITNPALKAGTWGPAADPDADGRTNVVEYALGSSPTSAEAFVNPLAIEVVKVAGTGYARVSHLVRTNEPQLTYRLSVGTGLDEWSATETGWVNPGAVSNTPVDANFSKRVRQLTRSTAVEARQFVQLEIDWGIDE